MHRNLLKLFVLTLLFGFLMPNNVMGQVDKNADIKTQRKQLLEFINNHPYSNNNLTPEEVKQMAKEDRPDLRAEHDFLMTFDPTLGYVPHDRKLKAFQEAQKRLAVKTAIPGATWAERGPNNIGGRSRAIMFDPNDANNKKVWSAGVGGGLWYNNDISSSTTQWQRVDDFWSNIAVSCIAYNPINTQIFYVGTGEGFGNGGAQRGQGIWKTTNGGTTWVHLSATTPADNNSTQKAFYYINDIEVAPNEDIYAGGKGRYTNRGGLLRSTDGGTSWSIVLAPNQGIGVSNSNVYDWVSDIEISQNGDVYAAIGLNGGEGRIYRSTNNGANWTDITPAAGDSRIEMAIAPSTGGTTANTTIYAIADGGNPDVGQDIDWFKKSTDGGATWSNLAIPHYKEQDCSDGDRYFTRNQAWYDLILSVKPGDPDYVIVGGIDLHLSTNGGGVWKQISHWTGVCHQEVHADIHAIEFSSTDNNKVIFGTDGGLYYSSNASSNADITIDARNKGFNVTQFYSCAMENTSGSNYFLAGAQDNGSQQFTQAGINSTTEVTGGDGAFCFIDQTNSNYQITSYVYNNWRISSNGGNSFSYQPEVNTGRFINPSDYDNVADILYSAAGDNEIYRITNVSGTPSATTRKETLGGKASAFAASPHTANVLFVGTGSGNVYKFTNANSSMNGTNLTGSLPAAYISCIEIGADDDHLLVTYSSYGGNQVYETKDGGSIWVNKTGNLPDMPVRFALYNPDDRNVVLLATEVGVWSTTNISVDSPDWDPTSTGLANVRCDMLQYRTSDKLVAVATHGRGLYTSDCFIPTTLMSYQSSTVTQNNISNVYLGQVDKQIIGIEIVMDGNTNPLDATLFSINTTGTTNTKDIENAKIYYTGTSPTFAASNQFGTTNASPSNSYTVSGAQGLVSGINYFWLTYDIKSSATGGNYVDAECTQITIGNSNKIPTVTAPTGSRKIADCTYCASSGSGSTSFGITNVTFNTIDNNSAVTGKYTDYSDKKTNVIQSSTYNLSTTLYVGNNNFYAKAWIDWNQNCDFNDTGEEYDLGLKNGGTSGTTSNSPLLVTVPAGASLGATIMRVSTKFGSSPSLCGDLLDGEVEDYTINVQAAGTAPTVTTQAVTSISCSTATGNGNITVLGSSNPTTHGVCWATTVNPTIADSHTDKGAATTTGAFTSSITGLTAGTTYHVRAYATNSVGTSYGADLTFTTDAATVGGSVTGGTTICSGSTSGTLTLSGHTGSVTKWQYSTNSGSNWSDISHTNTSYTSGALTQTTWFRAVVQNGSCNVENSNRTVVTVNPQPVAPISVSASATSITSGGSTTLSYSGGSGTTFRWLTGSCTGTSIGTGNNLNVTNITSTTTYYGRWENSCGNSTCENVTVTVTGSSTYDLSGLLKYDDTSTTIIANETVNLYGSDGTTLITTTTTDASGAYTFSSLSNGSYVVIPAVSLTWAGVTSMDVTIYKKHIGNAHTLTGLREVSGDVNKDAALNVSDVNPILTRIVGNTTAYIPAGDWAYSDGTITVNNANAILDIQSIFYGDGNATYFGSAPSKFENITIENNAVIYVEDGDSFEFPILINTNLNMFSSLTLNIPYDENKFQITDVILENSTSNAYYNINNGIIKIAYSTINHHNYSVGDNFITIKGFVYNITEETNISNDFSGEFGDYNNNIFSNINFLLPLFSPKNTTGINNNIKDIYIYPNPANNYLNILNAENSRVEVLNILGSNIIISQQIDKYNNRINTENLATGTYILKVYKNNEVIMKKFAIIK